MENPYQSPQTASPPPRPRYHRTTVCPHCGQPAMTLFRRFRMGPLRSRRCQACRLRVGVSWRAAFTSAAIGIAVSMIPIAGFVWWLASKRPTTRGNLVIEYSELETILTIAFPFLIATLAGGLQVLIQTYYGKLVRRE